MLDLPQAQKRKQQHASRPFRERGEGRRLNSDKQLLETYTDRSKPVEDLHSNDE